MPSVVFFHVGLFGVRHGYTRTHRHGRVTNEKCTHTKSGRTRTHCRREYWMRCLHFAYVTMLKLHPNHYIMCILFCEVFCFKRALTTPKQQQQCNNALNSHDETGHGHRNPNGDIEGKVFTIDMNWHTHKHSHHRHHHHFVVYNNDEVVVAANFTGHELNPRTNYVVYTVLFRSAMAIIWSKMRFKLCYNNH